jgi:hypothetical protein
MHAYTYQIALNPEITTINSLSGLTLPPVLFMQPASGPLAQLVEQLTFNQWVTGSNPVRLTTVFNDLAEILVKCAPLGETQGKLYLNYIRVLSKLGLRVR